MLQNVAAVSCVHFLVVLVNDLALQLFGTLLQSCCVVCIYISTDRASNSIFSHLPHTRSTTIAGNYGKVGCRTFKQYFCSADCNHTSRYSLRTSLISYLVIHFAILLIHCVQDYKYTFVCLQQLYQSCHFLEWLLYKAFLYDSIKFTLRAAA